MVFFFGCIGVEIGVMSNWLPNHAISRFSGILCGIHEYVIIFVFNFWLSFPWQVHYRVIQYPNGYNVLQPKQVFISPPVDYLDGIVFTQNIWDGANSFHLKQKIVLVKRVTKAYVPMWTAEMKKHG